ncbi:hypothetical protein SAMD00019534_048020 [Acytostelium subglobosum LB1]|uniref:hypothetical protein n=1 Tax=Acytostelium subglobosum LB1 TaxID=1410327 RepID=UPI00064503A5|nr:hypothetical protein SAMD00019534_048020 [Acytostelium subglobosum LB1]GAM21627.1 hypothetical protein SAMD00019534_048020 [Acytostelium subglobosum LB1]|eukprot:XP_012755746.1 hypothetical protein SAMD00019534_048020 [Acytostelium subglobosum LB1]
MSGFEIEIEAPGLLIIEGECQVDQVTQKGGTIIFENQTSILIINGQYISNLGAIIVYNDPLPGTTALMNVSGDISLTNSEININFVKTLPVANQQFNLIKGFGNFDYENVATNGSWSMDNTNVDTYKVVRMADNIVLTFYQTCTKYQNCYGHGMQY